MRHGTALLLVLAAAQAARAGPPVPPATVKLRVGDITSVEVKQDGAKKVAWRPGFAPEVCFVDEGVPFTEGTCRLIVSPKVAGVHRVVLWSVGEGREGSADLVIDATGGPGPTPPPVPPDPPPGPPPTPPPQPPPGTNPFPGTGLRMMVVYESADLARLPPAQLNVIYAKSVRDYLNAKCPLGPDGRTREWRMYDKDVDLSGESATWQNAMKRTRTSVPWVVVGNGTTWFEGPLPANADDTLKLLKKFGGE